MKKRRYFVSYVWSKYNKKNQKIPKVELSGSGWTTFKVEGKFNILKTCKQIEKVKEFDAVVIMFFKELKKYEVG